MFGQRQGAVAGGGGAQAPQAAVPAAQAASPQAADRRTFGSNKPPKYDEEGGFDLYKAMLRSYLTQ
ncbi:hypothetical protein PC121_g20094 [Phytophthora cactorum]|nr:hypothetical protein PC120_g20273 [Phytophthora cactorum]KAG3047380.1 hypothetical protein PC121_g20094 [Phytophthora cactorum]